MVYPKMDHFVMSMILLNFRRSIDVKKELQRLNSKDWFTRTCIE